MREWALALWDQLGEGGWLAPAIPTHGQRGPEKRLSPKGSVERATRSRSFWEDPAAGVHNAPFARSLLRDAECAARRESLGRLRPSPFAPPRSACASRTRGIVGACYQRPLRNGSCSCGTLNHPEVPMRVTLVALTAVLVGVAACGTSTDVGDFGDSGTLPASGSGGVKETRGLRRRCRFPAPRVRASRGALAGPLGIRRHAGRDPPAIAMSGAATTGPPSAFNRASSRTGGHA